MTIVLDFDDVVTESLESAIELFNKDYNTKLTVNSFREWNTDSVHKDFRSYFYKVDYTKVKEKNNSIYWIKKLAEQHDIFIATASCVDKFKEKEQWILKNLPCVKKENILLVRNKSILNGDVIVDDAIHNLNGKFDLKLLYSTPANKMNTKYRTIKDLGEVYKIVNEERI